jgi:cell division septation protein DedD
MGEGNRGERTIGSGHLVALFLGIVVLCCVFFILGYEMGRAQTDHGAASVSAAKGASPAPAKGSDEQLPQGWSTATPAASNSSAKTGPASSTPATGAGKSAGHAAASSASATPAKPSPAAAKPKSGGDAGPYAPPQIPAGAIVLQVAANKNETDALNLAKILQEKGFPAFVLTPSTDAWYRVQVGPFPDAKTADDAKAGLAKEGFKAIVKR